jgi:hypothetical protein
LAAMPCLIRWSADQNLHRKASQACRRNFIDANECQICGAPGSFVVPSNSSWYADREEKTSSADHLQRKASPLHQLAPLRRHPTGGRIGRLHPRTEVQRCPAPMHGQAALAVPSAGKQSAA